MEIAVGSAPAKLILCGEHAVVYHRPAIALPLAALRAEATVRAAASGSGLTFVSPALARTWSTHSTPDDPLCALALATLHQLGQPALDLTIRLGAAIPPASGLGSGAAIGAAIVRALAAYTQHTLTPAAIAALVYESERRFHGTPSGIDNTVVAYERALWFVRGQGDDPPSIEPIALGAPFVLVVGDTGVRSETRLSVAAVRARWQTDPPTYEALFDQIAAIVHAARDALAAGEATMLGQLLDANHALLVQLGASSPELERLVAAARGAGALGAKLAGAGWGGVMIALAAPSCAATIAASLHAAGAARVLVSDVAS